MLLVLTPRRSGSLPFLTKLKLLRPMMICFATFYTPTTQQHIAKQLGWRKFLYSSAYKALKNGNCESIELKPLGNRVQIDCVGSMVVSSMFLADQQQSLHLRVYMVQQNGQWFMDKAGYAAANLAALPVTYNRAGMKFKSEFE